MKISKRLTLIYLILISLFFSQAEFVFALENKVSSKKPYLTCPVVRERVQDFLKYHYLYRTFDPNISKRTFATYFKLLDPGKLYFTAEDIQSFQKYETVLGQKIENTDCHFIREVYDLYKKRVTSATQTITSTFKTPFEFKTKEFIETLEKNSQVYCFKYERFTR